MAFCFKKRELVSNAIRRLGRERVANALECLKDCGRAEAIHCARKDIKKTRAVLRLVRIQVERRQFRRLIERLREAARHLATPRDAYVKVKTLRNLLRHFKGQLSARALASIGADLRNAFDQEMKRFTKEKTAKPVARTLRRVAKELEALEVKEKGWRALGLGVKTAYADGQHAYRIALKDPSPENFHEWRKRAKNLCCQVTLLRPIWPEQMEAVARDLEMLSEYLGEDHDLVILRQAVEHFSRRNSPRRELKILNGLIDKRQPELRLAALAIGARFYAETPASFCNRLAEYWQIWCDKSTRSTRAVEVMRP